MLFVTGIPTVVMYVMSTWALVRMIAAYYRMVQGADPQPVAYVLLGISSLLVILAMAMLVEAYLALTRDDRSHPESKPVPGLAAG